MNHVVPLLQNDVLAALRNFSVLVSKDETHPNLVVCRWFRSSATKLAGEIHTWKFFAIGEGDHMAHVVPLWKTRFLQLFETSLKRRKLCSPNQTWNYFLLKSCFAVLRNRIAYFTFKMTCVTDKVVSSSDEKIMGCFLDIYLVNFTVKLFTQYLLWRSPFETS